MSFSPRILHIVRLSAIVFSLIVLAFYISSPSDSGYTSLFNIAVSGRKGAFVERASTTEIDGPFDNSTLVELCKSRTWTPGVIFKCEAPGGEIANVRNIILNCVRYAIEAGATGFIIPEILARGNSASKHHKTVQVPFNHFFDLDHFTHSLSTSCPQIHLYSHINDLWDKPSIANPILLSPAELSPLLTDTVIAQPANWSTNFNSYLNTTYTRAITPSFPVLVSLNLPLLQFPLSYDPPSFVSNYGKIVRFRPDIRRLAASVLYSLSQKHNLKLSPISQIQKGKFYSAHLRTEIDAQAAGWTPYAIQSVNYLSSAQRTNLSTIYLVAGNEEDVSRFSALAANHSISVDTKESLLGGELIKDVVKATPGERKGARGFEKEWAELKALTGEQKGAVDYEVALRSSAFGGTWESSFGWGVSMRRHVVVSGGGWNGFSIPLPPSTSSSALIPNEKRMLDTRGEWEIETSQADLVGKERGLERREKLSGVKETEIRRRKKNKIKGSGKGKGGVKVGEWSFVDGLSVVFGPRGRGDAYRLSMWP